MKNSISPKARCEELVVQEFADEILVYDLKANRVHCLNQTAAFVWKYCDGKNSVADIAGLLKVEDDFVRLAIALLDEKKLLDKKTPNRFNLPNRRELIKKIGFASAVVLLVVASLAVPANPAIGNANCACLSPSNCATQIGCPSLVNCNGSGICAP
jgi:Coenzyme PQQ synthesis protein D (PqqD)